MVAAVKRLMLQFGFILSLLLLIAVNTQVAQAAERLKDLVSIEGVRSNQILGYGLVVGLDGTGDKAPFTDQTFRNMMNRFGISIPQGVNPNLKNVAAVSVHADLPPFSKPGQKLDITVSSIGNASSLRGGSLLLTPLKGADGQIYATAQGNMLVGGFGAQGADGSRITVNVPSVGRIPNGATVERSVPTAFGQGDTITLNLHTPDFTTAKRVQERIAGLLGPGVAEALDATSVRVLAPREASQRVNFLSILENLEITPAEGRAKVVINSRTGTIVVGQNVKVLPAAVTHGNLTVTISEGAQISQPNALADGDTVVVPETDVAIDQEPTRMFRFGPATTLNEIVRAVNQVGAAPGDVMAVLEALKQAGALKADVIVI